VPGAQNERAYSGAQDLSISPDGPIGTPALQGSLSDPSTFTHILFSELSVDSRARRARARASYTQKDAIKVTRLSNDKKRQFTPFRVRRLTRVVDVDSPIIPPSY